MVDELGELVITAPMPSMPVGFWGDADGSRYRATYFADYPGIWRHGDWIRCSPTGSCVIAGRSDATLNRGRVRLVTAEFYRVVEELPQIADSLVVHLEDSPTASPTRSLKSMRWPSRAETQVYAVVFVPGFRTRSDTPDSACGVPGLGYGF